jgi:hypothetical protein
LDYTMDVIYWCDIVVNFRTAYMEKVHISKFLLFLFVSLFSTFKLLQIGNSLSKQQIHCTKILKGKHTHICSFSVS